MCVPVSVRACLCYCVVYRACVIDGLCARVCACASVFLCSVQQRPRGNALTGSL